MAIFGRRAARKRLRRATEQALAIPAFQEPVDCTPWVLGGIWPQELVAPSAATASVAEYLKRDLQRIADSANEKLHAISMAGLAAPVRQAEETRVVNVARAFAVLRVESTVRQLRREPLGFQQEYLSLAVVPDEPTVIVAAETTLVLDRIPNLPASPAAPQEPEAPEAPPLIAEPESPATRAESIPDAIAPSEPGIERNMLEHNAIAVVPKPAVATDSAPAESATERLRRLLEFVARQEPGLRWAAGQRADGSTVLITDLAHGWIPSGIKLPAGIELLPPQRRHGNLTALLGAVDFNATYRPGDPFSAPLRQLPPVTESDPRTLPEVPDLGWALTETTQWREGLPRIAQTMAKAGASGTGVVDAELDVLRVHLDTARYQVFAEYPEVSTRTLGNCLLLAATEAIATGDRTAANYHFSWYTAVLDGTDSGWPQHS